MLPACMAARVRPLPRLPPPELKGALGADVVGVERQPSVAVGYNWAGIPTAHAIPSRREGSVAMTTAKPKIRTHFRLPDPPEHPDDKMTRSKHLSETGQHHHLAMHLGNPETTIVAGDRYVVVRPTRSMAGSHYPDLLVAFDVDPELYEANNGYVISEQGKPPDFVLEVASRHTGHIDIGEKRAAYAAIGIGEYWRFDETGQFHRTRLAGDRLVNQGYEAIPIDELSAEAEQGYSDALDLNLRWERGTLGLYNPATGLHIATFTSERLRADQERARADREQAGRIQAEARADQEQAARRQAEARVREMEEQIRRLRGD